MKRIQMIRRFARMVVALSLVMCVCAVVAAQQEIVIDKLPMTLDKPGATYVMNKDLSARRADF